jgi:16S rRNA (guanine1516-N2)-methyltransferase
LESNVVIATLVAHGLATYGAEAAVKQAMQRIQVVPTDYSNYLYDTPDRSFDIVMFDPMFRETIIASSAMQTLKPLANSTPVGETAVKEALRVARRAILLKERRGSPEFARLGFTIVHSTKAYAWGRRTCE